MKIDEFKKLFKSINNWGNLTLLQHHGISIGADVIGIYVEEVDSCNFIFYDDELYSEMNQYLPASQKELHGDCRVYDVFGRAYIFKGTKEQQQC